MNGLKKEDYSNFEVVEQAVNAVIRGKDIREQAVVDGYAAAIRDAVKSLEPVPVLPVQIPIIEGAEQEVEKGGTNGVIIKVDGDINSFVDVSVDDTVIAEDQYTVTAGSTIITLKPEYIETLTEGTHTVTIRFADGFAQTTLKVKEKVTEGPGTEEPDPEEPGPEEPGPEEPGPEEPGPEKPGDSLNNGQTQKPSDSSGGQGQSPAENQTPGQKDKNRAPLTGDDMPINALLLLLLASAAGMIAGRRRRTI